MFWKKLLATSLLACLALWATGTSLAQIQVETRVDVPDRRGNPGDAVELRDLVGGLFALRDGYDRSRQGYVCALTYEDANGNGRRDRGEGPLPGIRVAVESGGSAVARGAADAKGRFCNESPLQPGPYSIRAASPTGWTNTEPGAAAPDLKSVDLPGGKSVTVLFGYCRADRCRQHGGPAGPPPPPPPPSPTLLRFHKVVQSNAPGGAFPLTGLTFGTMFEVFHNCAAGGQTWTNVTDLPNGATFPSPGHAGIPVGAVCTITETPPQGSIPFAPCASGTGRWQTPVIPTPHVMTSGANTVSITNKFVCDAPPPASTAEVCVVKFFDYDADGVQDPGEPALPGWIFAVRTPANSVLAFGTTDPTGRWCSGAHLPAGAVKVVETPKAGWVSSVATPAGGSGPTLSAVLASGQTTNLAFGNRTARICVTKFNDLNGNGVRNTGEPALPGWAFSLEGITGTLLESGVTDAQGLWCSSVVLPVGYPVKVIETQQAGWQNTAPGGTSALSPTPSVLLALTQGQTVNVRFGNWVPPSTGQVCVRKFRDLNSDGQQTGAGEPPLAGWSFTVAGPSGPLTITTAANGKACTPANLTPGTYTVTETAQAGWTNSAPGDGTSQRTANVTPYGPVQLDFGNAPVAPGIICVSKYQERSNNHVYDAGTDTMLSGWTFQVRNSAGTVVASGATDAQGHWCTASPLPAGTYTVTEVQQAGWVVVDPAGPPNWSPPYRKSAIVSSTRGADLFFGNIPAGRVCITKYNDLNGNGHRDAGEPALSGFVFRFQYMGAAGVTDVTLPTPASGELCLDLPPSPDHMVYETQKPGWTNTDPGAAGTTVYGQGTSYHGEIYAVVEGQTTHLEFGNHQTGTPTYGRICVVKFNDLNGDGMRQAGEAYLPGWAFSIPTPNGTMSSTTDANGGWCTPQVFPTGSYTVTETLKPGWSPTTTGGVSQFAAVTGGQTTNLVFGNRLTPPAPGQICVIKFKDVNGDGIKQANEPVLPNWTFTVSGSSTPQSGSTDEQKGEWCTDQTLAAGTYTVTETMKPGWVSTTPGGSTPQLAVTVNAGHTTTVLFGNRQLATPTGQVCIVKYNDLDGDGLRDSGEPAMAGWSFPLRKTNGAPAGSITSAGAAGTGCLSLAPGAYIARETQQAGWTNTDPGSPFDKPFTVVSNQTTNLVFGNFQPPQPPVLSVQKVKLTSGICHGSAPAQNQCAFQITVTNTGGSAYAGPLSLVDTVTGAQATVLTAPGLICPTGPQAGAFTCTVPPGPIPAGGSVQFQMTLSLASAAPAQKNCVVLNYLVAGVAQSSTACAQIFP
jgi:uncharacterized protein (DUF2141 family)